MTVLVVSSEEENWVPSNFGLCNIALAILSLSHFPKTFKTRLTISAKGASWEFDMDPFKSAHQSGGYYHLNNLVFLSTDMGCLFIFLYLFQYLSTYCIVLTSFVKFISSYFITLKLL